MLHKTVEPYFGRCFEFSAVLPGASQLEIAVWDWDKYSPDDKIGFTTIDLEDRLFSKKWRDLGTSFQVRDDENPDNNLFALKPLERRSLWRYANAASARSSSSGIEQGSIRLWVDIITPEEAKLYIPVDVAPPPPAEMELRLVVWKTRDVVADKGEFDQNDLYAECFMEGGKKQRTDTHWRAKNGKGSFNWRMKFPIMMPMKEEFRRLHVTLWDKDIIGANDAICGGVLDLTFPLAKAFRMADSEDDAGKTVQVYTTKKKPKTALGKAGAMMGKLGNLGGMVGLGGGGKDGGGGGGPTATTTTTTRMRGTVTGTTKMWMGLGTERRRVVIMV